MEKVKSGKNRSGSEIRQGAEQAGGSGEAWNRGRAPEDWWGEMERFHGHVGPWNVLGWRIGQAALRELGSGWGRHEIELICYCPPATPYTCLFDGLIAGTGNSPGRLDARLQEAFVMAQIHVAARRKDGSGPTLLFEPSLDYLRSISGKPHEELERLARDAAQRPESELFAVRRIA